MLVAALTTLLLAADPATHQALIVGGGKSKEDAEHAAAEVRAKIFYLEFIEGQALPIVRRSDEVEGLKPGLFVAVLGFCAKERHSSDELGRLLKALQRIHSGSYVRDVRGDLGDDCPPLGALAAPSKEEKAFRDAIARDKKRADPFVAYGSYLEGRGRFHEAQVFLARALALDPGNTAAEKLLEKISVLEME